MTQQHQPRMEMSDYSQIAPAVTTALRALSKAVDDTALDKALIELIKVRASQINGCTFCLQFHINRARKFGLSQVKLDLAAVWQEAGVFSERERAALAWTETLTLMAGNGVGDPIYHQVQQQFSTEEIAFLTAAIGAINAWNRIAGGLLFTPQAS
jgi:AhpD family alkylhydroperoxidase